VLVVGCVEESNGVWRLEEGRSLSGGKVREEKDVSLGGRLALRLDRFKSRRLQARYERIRQVQRLYERDQLVERVDVVLQSWVVSASNHNSRSIKLPSILISCC
jgi:hypothetical protein